MELKNLETDVLNVFQALSLILVFLSIYFGIKFPEIQKRGSLSSMVGLRNSMHD